MTAPPPARPASRRPVLRIVTEAAALVGVVGAGLLVIAHLVLGPWADYLYINGDSVVLALLRDSFDRGEPLQWVFSTQNFFFPEAPFYLLCSLFGAPPVAYSLNVMLNVLVLYGLLRAVAHELRSPGSVLAPPVAALLATWLYVAFVLTEIAPSPNRSGISTLYVLSTYYFGVTVGGLALLALTLRLIRQWRTDGRLTRRIVISAAGATVLVALITFSNLLFLLEVVAPLAVVVLLLLVAARFSLREVLLLAVPVAGGLAVAMLLRQIFASVFRAGVENYVALSFIPTAVKNLFLTVEETLAMPLGGVKLVILLLLHLAALAVVAWLLWSMPRAGLRAPSDRIAIVAMFTSVSAAAVMVGQVITGSTSSRYLQVLVTFALPIAVIAVLWLLARLPRAVPLKRVGVAVLGAVAGTVLILGSTFLPAVARQLAAPLAQIDCLEEFTGSSDINGVGSFWLSRPYDLYGDQAGRILQVNPDLTVQAWMINLAAYDQDRFSYVVVDGTGLVPEDAVIDELGVPADVVDCGSYSIYDYRGTDGEGELTDRVRESLALLRAEY